MSTNSLQESAIHIMREVYRQIFKEFFFHKLTTTRYSLGFSQAQMADVLCMDERSYVDLDHGKSSCSAVTLVLFLIYCYPDPLEFLSEIKLLIESSSNIVA